MPTTQEPVLADLPPEVRRLQADMSVADVSIEALLVQPHIQVCACAIIIIFPHFNAHCAHSVTMHAPLADAGFPMPY